MAVLLKAGGCAEYVTVIEDHVIPIPGHMTMEEAASIPESWIAAYQLLHFVGNQIVLLFRTSFWAPKASSVY